MSKTSLKALTLQNITTLPKHNDFKKKIIKINFKKWFLTYYKILNILKNKYFFLSFKNNIFNRYIVNKNFKLISFIFIPRNNLKLKFICYKYNKKYINTNIFFNNRCFLFLNIFNNFFQKKKKRVKRIFFRNKNKKIFIF